MNYKQILDDHLFNFNKSNQTLLRVDTIRISFSKQHKLSRLKKVGFWHKVTPSSKISSKLKKRLSDEEVTSAYQLEDYNIYFFNSQDRPLYRKAVMVIFGLSQYDDREVPHYLIDEILHTLGNISNIDICFDFDFIPKLDLMQKRFKLIDFKNYHQTYYCNNPQIQLIEKFVIYNKSLKNGLKDILYRIEFKVWIHNIKDLYLPLDEIINIISLIPKPPVIERINAKGRNV